MRVDRMCAGWNRAASRWDPWALTALYTGDAILFGGREGHAVGSTGIRDYFSSYQGVIESASLVLTEQELLETSATSLFTQGFCDFVFTLAGGRRTQSRLRSSWLLDWSSGRELIRAHHFSAIPEAPPLDSRSDR
ncbi:hypothetical protein [Hyphomonas sp. ND6WE1B]|uniref:hypothetical protein n=1 Tax=Hyphomonas sp. ND6WE1B TaxID=1848191 RepID=UPI0011119821|nr:hypothetical protein [Hyphomonas sp. ND6WE1B]